MRGLLRRFFHLFGTEPKPPPLLSDQQINRMMGVREQVAVSCEAAERKFNIRRAELAREVEAVNVKYLLTGKNALKMTQNTWVRDDPRLGTYETTQVMVVEVDGRDERRSTRNYIQLTLVGFARSGTGEFSEYNPHGVEALMRIPGKRGLNQEYNYGGDYAPGWAGPPAPG